jgi:methylthioribose-1-phosphate isomerase
VNPEIAVARQLAAMAKVESLDEKIHAAKSEAIAMADEDAEFCRRIGIHGLKIIEEIASRKNGRTVNILTHCNAGWLAFVDYGSATAPIYQAFENKIGIHVWVDETRPRNQGSALTAWELLNHSIPHTIITDNAGGHLMQHGLVDMVITGADRVTRTGDVANKIGTYLKALAAFDNKTPFYVALPSSTFDWKISDGLKEINIEERSADEVKYAHGLCDDEMKEVLLAPKQSGAMNYGFDITPSRLITGLITERGVCAASEKEIVSLFQDKQHMINHIGA